MNQRRMNLTDEDIKMLAGRLRSNPIQPEDLLEQIRSEMQDADETLRTSTDHHFMLAAQGRWNAMLDLVLFIDNRVKPKSKPRSSSTF